MTNSAKYWSWLVGCFGLNGRLRQHFSLYRAVSQRKEERKEKRQTREKMSKQPPPAPTESAVGPCPTIIKISGTPQHWKFTQHHRFTRPPPFGHGLICIATFKRSSPTCIYGAFEHSFPFDYLETELDATCEYFATCTNVHTHTHEDAHKRYNITTTFFCKVAQK